jgi:hypothetical protein
MMLLHEVAVGQEKLAVPQSLDGITLLPPGTPLVPASQALPPTLLVWSLFFICRRNRDLRTSHLLGIMHRSGRAASDRINGD